VAKTILELKQKLLKSMVSYMEVVPLKDGKPAYSQKDVYRCFQILDGYLASLATVPEKNKNDFILDAVKKTILELNQLNHDCHQTIIETIEREYLCNILVKAAIEAGLDPDLEDNDITLQWREW
jgi:hypothetical protein